MSPNRQHGQPLASGSCNPPQLRSTRLTIGTPDSNGQTANAQGSVIYRVRPGDVSVRVAITDVRRQGTLADYTGELGVAQAVQITDRLSGPSGAEPATAQPNPFRFAVPCAATAATSVGSTCSLQSTLNAIVPGAVVAGKRAVWALNGVDVFDGGTDDHAATTGDNTLFEREGVFVPDALRDTDSVAPPRPIAPRPVRLSYPRLRAFRRPRRSRALARLLKVGGTGFEPVTSCL